MRNGTRDMRNNNREGLKLINSGQLKRRRTRVSPYSHHKSAMGTPRVDISFQTVDNVTLRGWFYESSDKSMPAPTLVMCHGFTAVKEMDLDAFAEYFTSKLPIAVLVYDHRGFGASDHAPGHPRNEIIISEQHSDLRDAITYAQSRPDVDENKIGIWGSSYAGGHVLWVGATDRRVKVVMSQVPCVDGWESYHRLVPGDAQATLNELFQKGQQTAQIGPQPCVRRRSMKREQYDWSAEADRGAVFDRPSRKSRR